MLTGVLLTDVLHAVSTIALNDSCLRLTSLLIDWQRASCFEWR